MGTNLIGELVANNGTYYLHAGSLGTSYTGSIDQIIVRGEGFVIQSIEIIRNGYHEDVTNDYISNSVMPNGLRITPKNNEVFNRITIAAEGGNGGVELVLAA